LFRVLAPCPCLTVFPCVRRGSRCKQTIRITLRDAVNIAAEPAGAIANLNLAESQESGNSACAALLRAASFHASKDIVRGHVAAPIGKNDFHVPQTLRALLDHGSRAKLLSSGLRPEAMAKMARLQGDGASAAQQNTARSRTKCATGRLAVRALADVSAAKARFDPAKTLPDLDVDQQNNGVGTRIDTRLADTQHQKELQRYSEA